MPVKPHQQLLNEWKLDQQKARHQSELNSFVKNIETILREDELKVKRQAQK